MDAVNNSGFRPWWLVLSAAPVAGFTDFSQTAVGEMLFVIAAGRAGDYDHFRSVGVPAAAGQNVQLCITSL